MILAIVTILIITAVTINAQPIANRGVKVADDKMELRTQYLPQVRFGRYHILAPKVLSPDTTYNVVLLLHGNGHGPEVMLDWSKDLNLANTIYIAPEAPYLKWRESKVAETDKFMAILIDSTVPDSMQAEIINTSAQWYHDVMKEAMASLRTTPIKRSAFDLTSNVRKTTAVPLTYAKPHVVGFSQGGFFAQVLATRHPNDFAGVVSMSGSMYAAGNVVERYPVLRTMPVLLCHGRQDDIVPFRVATECVDALTQAKVEHTFIPFEGGHWPTPEITAQIRRWLSSTKQR